MYIIRFSADAEADAAEAGKWYDEQSIGLSLNFYEDLNNAIRSLKSNPKINRKYQRYKNIRRKNLSIFPYKIFYTIIGQSIYILAIIHHKRSVKYIKTRLK